MIEDFPTFVYNSVSFPFYILKNINTVDYAAGVFKLSI